MSKEFKVFLASSGELSDEREVVKELINKHTIVNIKYEIIMWEDMLHSFHKQGFQSGTVNPILKECEIVIFLFHSKIGKFTQEEWNDPNKLDIF